MPAETLLQPGYNPLPQNAPGNFIFLFLLLCVVELNKLTCFSLVFLGSAAAIGHTLENSIPLSIFPVAPDKFAICFCGLPGRGKTHISRRLGRYLEFFHAIPVQVFHAADYRRRLCGALKDADWFDPENEEAQHFREEAQHLALKDMATFLAQHSNGVAIIDAINETHHKRQAVVDEVNYIYILF